MKELKQEFKHILKYLPYNLQLWDGHIAFECEGVDIYQETLLGERTTWTLDEVKPTLIPFKEINDEIVGQIKEWDERWYFDKWSGCLIRENGMLDTAYHGGTIENAPTWVTHILLRNHVDLHGLIREGYAVNKNEIKRKV